MADRRSLRLAPEWDHRFTRMVGVSAAVHVVAIVALIGVATRSPPPPLPLVAYTVEITDPSALGGRLPPGAPGKDLSGGATKPAPAEPPAQAAPEPASAAEAPEEAKAPSPPPVEEAPPPEPPQPTPTVPAPPKAPPQPPPTVASKAPEPAPVIDKKAEAPKPEPPKTTPSTVPPRAATNPPKPTPPKPEAKGPPKPAEAPTAAARAEPRPPATGQAAPGAVGAASDAPVKDAYAAAAERWRSHAGGGLGGDQEASGPVGSGGDGRGGGGQLVGIEFLSYRQRVIDTIKSHWTNVILRPGLVASVRFVIAADGEVSDIRLAQSSNNPAYDASVLRAVQQVHQLPPPPARYANEFRDFQIEFHSEETGGRGAG